MNFWRQLQPRERLFLGGGVAVLVLFLFFKVAIDPLFKEHLHVVLGMKSRVGRKLDVLKDIFVITDGLKILPRAFYHRL